MRAAFLLAPLPGANAGAALVRSLATISNLPAAVLGLGRDGSRQPRRPQADPDRCEPAQYIAARRNAAQGASYGIKAMQIHDRSSPLRHSGVHGTLLSIAPSLRRSRPHHIGTMSDFSLARYLD
jgi:hypothetical protein